MTLTPEQTSALSAPLDRKYVKQRQQGGANVSYIEGWHAISEANRIFGFGGWERHTLRLEETNRDLVTIKNQRGEYQQWRVGYLAVVGIKVGDVVRQGTGFGSGMARPEALGEAIESASKEAETDAMKRALMTWGNVFGLALYDKTQANVEDGSRKQSSANTDTPFDAPEETTEQKVKRLAGEIIHEIAQCDDHITVARAVQRRDDDLEWIKGQSPKAHEHVLKQAEKHKATFSLRAG